MQPRLLAALRRGTAIGVVCLLAACASRAPAAPEKQPSRVVERDLSGSAGTVTQRP